MTVKWKNIDRRSTPQEYQRAQTFLSMLEKIVWEGELSGRGTIVFTPEQFKKMTNITGCVDGRIACAISTGPPDGVQEVADSWCVIL